MGGSPFGPPECAAHAVKHGMNAPIRSPWEAPPGGSVPCGRPGARNRPSGQPPGRVRRYPSISRSQSTYLGPAGPRAFGGWNWQTSLRFRTWGRRSAILRHSVSAARCERLFLHISARAGGVQPRRAHDSAGRVSLHVHVTTAALNGSASAEGGRPQMLTLQCGPRSGGPSHCASPRGGPTQLRRTRASVGRISLRGVVTVAAPNASASAGGRDLQASTLCTAGPCVESQISTRACTTGPHSYGVHVSPESASRSTSSAPRRPRAAPPALGGDL